jgi:hypothetical protein
MTESEAWHNPSEDYPPSRPGMKTLLALGGIVVVALAIAFWPAISAFIYLPQIRAAIGM